MKCVWVMMLFLHCASSERFEVVGPDAPVVATAGSDVILPCSVQRENEKTNMNAVDLNIKWTRPDLGGPLVHFYANHKDMNTGQIPHFRGRTALFKEELQNGNTSLRLTEVNLHDEGEYRCNVESGLWYNDFTFKLAVEVIGTPPVISVKKYDSNSKQFSLLCESKGWWPEPDLQWLNSERDILTVGVTESQRHAELFSVNLHIALHYRDIDTFYCRVTLREHMIEEKIKPTAIYAIIEKRNPAVEELKRVICALLKSEKKQCDDSAVQMEKSEKKQHDDSAKCIRLLNLLRNYPLKDLKKKLQEKVESRSAVMLTGLGLTEKSCAVLASALSSEKSSVKELDLSKNKSLQDSGVKKLCEALKSPNCKLETLKLTSCSITDEGCAALIKALKSNPLSQLTELNLNNNKPAVKELSDLLQKKDCKLEKLQLSDCSITDAGCAALVKALISNHSSQLKELNLSYNKPGYSAVKELSDLLRKEECKLEKLELEWCYITDEGCAALIRALKSNPSQLRELNLNINNPGQSGVKELSDLLNDPPCKLEKLQLADCRIKKEDCASLIEALKSNHSQLRELNLSYNKPGESGVKELSELLNDPRCKLEKLQLQWCGITFNGCAELFKALKSNCSSQLKELNLNNNYPGDFGMKELCKLLEDPHCKLEKLQLADCRISDERCVDLFEALKSNRSPQLTELDLDNNYPGDSGVKVLSDLLKEKDCKLQKLQLAWGGITEEGCVALFKALKSNPSSPLRELNLSRNKPGESGVKELSGLLKDPHCKLEKLQLADCRITKDDCVALANALKSNPSSQLRELNLNYNEPGDSGVKELCDLLKDPQCKLVKLQISTGRCPV
ncbi:ran GTPase-activating protein 2-like isoform X2 [Colossoma macropomum]|uniref:ran GTPase-activating protein 2-like isoform X2 n=1 Tax=Colossoma macropomum TaxID=42526 RepID=UPI00186481B6|nr:ran GTPase-activating protein 2-like isoform X2 [Colossoma macropomum]